MVHILVILFISFVISLYVIIPLVKGYSARRFRRIDTISLDNSTENDHYDLIKKKDLIIDEIVDIDFDFGLGKLNSQDYNEIKDKYRHKAGEILKRIDEIEDIKAHSKESDSIENKILQVKRSIQSGC